MAPLNCTPGGEVAIATTDCLVLCGQLAVCRCLKVLEQMKRELRRKMEREISELQRRLCDDEDGVYFRELDAERVRRELHLARCQTRL